MMSKKQKTLKGSMLVVLLLLIPSMLYAACTGTSPNLYAASANQSDVMACVNVATYGDTINVPAGSATWTAQSQGCTGNSMLCMKKGINLKGAGSASTIITLSGSAPYGAIAYEADSTSRTNDTPFEFIGFTINGNGQPYGEGMLDVRNNGPTAITKVKIHDNIFKNNTSEVIVINGPVYGVAYSNKFIDCTTIIKVEGYNATSWNLGHREYGTAKSFYFEDNTANCTTAKSCGAFTAGQGGGIVYRYNTMNMGHVLLDGNQWNDLHGLQSMTDIGGGRQCGYSPYNVSNSCLPEVKSCTEWSQVKSEWYGNNAVNFYNPYSTPQEWMRHRGSWLLMFYNNIEGTGRMPIPEIYQYSCDSCASSGTYSQHVQNTYVWSNIGQGEGNRPISVLQDNCGSYAQGTPYKIKENVDFWNYKASFNGTSGIGCGPLANLPATCTTGVAYWATNQSCTDMAGMVGANPLNPISGTLYKCTSTNKWEPYYTPYTYPHPLRSSTVSYTENPQSPAPTTPEVPTTPASPTVSVSPTMKDFGALPVSTSSSAQKFTVTTTGGSLNVDSISMTGTDANQFTIQNDSCTGKIIAPETGSCTFYAKFSPSSAGAKAANVAIVDNDSNTTETIALSGIGAANQTANTSFSPTSLYFYRVPSGSSSAPRTVTLSNTGTGPLTISSVYLSGTNANQFYIPVTTDYCTGETIAASGKCSFQVIFSPTSGGDKTANLNLTTLYYGSPATLPLSGTGVVIWTSRK